LPLLSVTYTVRVVRSLSAFNPYFSCW